MQNQTLSAEQLNIQTVDLHLNDYLHRKLKKMTGRLRKLLPDINWMDIYLKENQDPEKPRTMVIRFGIPGPDLVATESGTKWKLIFKNAEKKLARQIEKKKAMWRRGKEQLALTA